MRIGIPENFQGIPGMTVEGISGVAGTVTSIPVNQDPYKDKFFQWMGGPNLGLVEKVDRTVIIDGKQTIILESGVQIPADEFAQKLKLIEKPSSSMGRVIKTNESPPLTPEAEALMQSLKTKENMPNVSEILSNKQNISQSNIQSNINLSDPAIVILSKRKESIFTINCSLNLDLPKQTLFDMLIDDFGKTPEEIIKLIIDNKNIELIKTQLINILLNYYGKEPISTKTKTFSTTNETLSEYKTDIILDSNLSIQDNEGAENENQDYL